ncbi:MAG: hypothetical protein N3B01_05900 [Verrucomicrobiae bacterium]|nr:hypothetical protein [Verrucomicrobiae bacterium]
MSTETETVEIGPRDIVFSCPMCQKSMVVDEAAEGLTVECPGCGGAVIVPPKPDKPVESVSVPWPAEMEERLSALLSRLRELQTQRAEINANIISRLNDINRQMVLLTRLENAQQQVLQEWNQILASFRPVPPPPPSQEPSAKS